MNQPVKIVVAEPSDIVRTGMVVVLRRLNALHLEVFEVVDREQLRNSLNWFKPGILLVNPVMIGDNSLSQIRRSAYDPDMKCVALQSGLIHIALLRSYDEVLTLYDTAEQIEGKLTRLIKRPEERRHEALSDREKEVIRYVIRGYTNKQIADKLCLSTHTVITHRRNISVKLDIHSTAGLTIYAIVNKLVEIGEIGE